ncbi:MAG: glutathione-regulated potassium-efflux system ancillary protein KefC [Betaproteobacteria bacterium]|jgi:glutathione-regulated potassium-efflux system protein KefB|nr:glutathione-regulated potassium-efflux system ancillary protein KefC [Betaproteobacteria bacterium]
MENHAFLQQALVYLLAGVIAVPIFQRLKLGAVLGYLVAGMVIGPWGLGLIGDPQTVLGFAEFGVVLLLFLVGLELNAQRVWALRRSIFGLGAVQVLVTIAATVGIALLFKQPLLVGIVAGMGIAMSSTAIGLALLSEKNLLGTPGGQASFAVLLFQDLAVVPLLIVLGLLSGDGGEELSWTGAATAFGMIALLITAGRFLVRPLLRYIAETRLREVFVGFSLLLVLGTAALMELVGLSMALGAFLAGVMLAESEYRHELELDIEPFKGLLLGLFFIAVGMSVDLGLFLRSPLLVIGLAIGIVALKAGLLYTVARPFYCGTGDAALFAVALSQAGEFAFVLFAAASKILPPETVAVLNAAVAVSMLTTPFLMMGYERFLRGRRQRREERAPDTIRESNPVIVAGFGRFGQVVVRVLRGLGIGATVIDHDPGQIDTVRRFGWKAYYGDATRMDLLESAGAATAKVLLVAIDDPEAALAAVKRVRQRFPQLEVIARARSRTDAYDYAELGVPAVREVFGSALEAAGRVLRTLGFAEDEVARIVRRFHDYDEAQIPQNAPHRNDVKKLVAISEQGRRDIAQLLAAEAHSAPQIDEHDAGADQRRRDREGGAERLT